MIIKKLAIIKGKKFIRFWFDPDKHESVCKNARRNKSCRHLHWEEPSGVEICRICGSIHKIVKGLNSKRIPHYTYYGE